MLQDPYKYIFEHELKKSAEIFNIDSMILFEQISIANIN